MKAKVYDFYTDIFPTDEEVKELCKPGEGVNTCSWLLMSSKGWECCCLNKPISLVNRRKLKTMTAMRDGCDKVNLTVLPEIEFYYPGIEIEF